MSNKDLPLLGPLDEDDEFEEFEVQGEWGFGDEIERLFKKAEHLD